MARYHRFLCLSSWLPLSIALKMETWVVDLTASTGVLKEQKTTRNERISILCYKGDIPFEAQPTSPFHNNEIVHVNLIA